MLVVSYYLKVINIIFLNHYFAVFLKSVFLELIMNRF